MASGSLTPSLVSQASVDLLQREPESGLRSQQIAALDEVGANLDQQVRAGCSLFATIHVQLPLLTVRLPLLIIRQQVRMINEEAAQLSQMKAKLRKMERVHKQHQRDDLDRAEDEGRLLEGMWGVAGADLDEVDEVTTDDFSEIGLEF